MYFSFFPFVQLLTIFVSERLADFLKFYKENKDFVNGLGKRNETVVMRQIMNIYKQSALASQNFQVLTLPNPRGLPSYQQVHFVQGHVQKYCH